MFITFADKYNHFPQLLYAKGALCVLECINILITKMSGALGGTVVRLTL